MPASSANRKGKNAVDTQSLSKITYRVAFPVIEAGEEAEALWYRTARVSLVEHRSSNTTRKERQGFMIEISRPLDGD